MTENRYIVDVDEAIIDTKTNREYTTWDISGVEDICDKLNNLTEENEQLKQAYTQLKHRHSLLYDVCIDAECDRDSYHKDVVSLEKENEQLKQQIKIFEKFLEENDLSIDWDEFCGVVGCAFENPDFSCKDCIHLKGDVE